MRWVWSCVHHIRFVLGARIGVATYCALAFQAGSKRNFAVLIWMRWPPHDFLFTNETSARRKAAFEFNFKFSSSLYSDLHSGAFTRGRARARSQRYLNNLYKHQFKWQENMSAKDLSRARSLSCFASHIAQERQSNTQTTNDMYGKPILPNY